MPPASAQTGGSHGEISLKLELPPPPDPASCLPQREARVVLGLVCGETPVTVTEMPSGILLIWLGDLWSREGAAPPEELRWA